MTAFRFACLAWGATTVAALLAGDDNIRAQAAQQTATAATYVGSAACARCHAPIYDRWKLTRVANVVRDPKEHPDAIIPDLGQPNPLVTFTKDRHMPAIEQTIADVMVRSHTFRFITPALTESSRIPNPCTSCHKDKSNAWASETLRRWPEFSPWRVGF